jgi:hypothetical protein
MTFKEKSKLLVSDIRIWILLFFAIRMFGITDAPLEFGHNWRQTLTNMMTRNFYEGGVQMLYPKIDMAGNQTGIIGSEFPIFNYVTYLLSSVFGYEHWHGRLINLVVSSFGIYYFFLLIEKIWSKTVAFNATIVLLSSIWFGFARKTMPDTFSIALMIIGLYHCFTYVTSGKKLNLLLFFFFSTLGMLCKIPALSLLAAIPVLILEKEVQLKRKIEVFITSLIGVSIVFTWYFYWVPYLVDAFNYKLYFPKSLLGGFKEIKPVFAEYCKQFYKNALCSFVGFGFVIYGSIALIQQRNKYILFGLSLITVVFLAFTIKTGAVFPLHSYYIIPFTPIMALIVGIGLSKIPAKFQVFFLLVISIEAIANQQHDFFIKDSEKYKLSFERTVDKYIPKKDLIIINAGPNPQEMYFTHRKGWSYENFILNQNELDSLHKIGANYLIINKERYSEPISYYPKIYSGPNYDIYELKKKK